MIDTSVVRVHQHGACIAGNRKQQMGRSRGGLTSKIHAVVDADGLPVRLGLTAGEAHDNRLCSILLNGLRPRTMLLADRGYDADWIRDFGNRARLVGQHPAETKSQRADLFQPLPLPRAQPRRTVLQQDQAVSAPWPHDTTSLLPTISPSSSSHPFGYGCAFMSSRPSQVNLKFAA